MFMDQYFVIMEIHYGTIKSAMAQVLEHLKNINQFDD